MGAYDYIHKPFNVDELKIVVPDALERRQLRRENVLLKRALGERAPVLEHHRPQRVDAGGVRADRDDRADDEHRADHRRVGHRQGAGRRAPSTSTRRARSGRSSRVNCGALTETLLESELFGHVRGAFTGADTNKKGLIEVAERGTIFLDEIGEMSPLMQVKLLRVLQERVFRRVGGTEEIAADIRIIAATNRDLAQMVAENRFREDLYYRINVIPRAPAAAARARRGHPAAGRALRRRASRRAWASRCRGWRPRAWRCSCSTDWPGNIRELENVIERAVALERTPVILPPSLPAAVRAAGGGRAGDARPRAGHAARFRLRPRAPRPRDRAPVHHRGAAPHRRRQGEGRRAARHELPLVPLLRQEIRPLGSP